MRAIRLPLPLYAPADKPGDATGDDKGDQGTQQTGDQNQSTGGDAGGQDTGAGGDTGGDAGGEAGGTKDASTGDDKGDGKPKPKSKDWRDREIDKKHQQLLAERTERQRLTDENKRLKELAEAGTRRQTGQDGDTGDQTGQQTGSQPQRREFHSQEEFDAAVQQATAQTQLQRDALAIERKGTEDYGQDRWSEAIDTLKKIAGTDGVFDADTMSTIMATDDPARVLFELGSNPENYQRIMGMDAGHRRIELVKLSLAQKGKTGVSGAPKPVDAIGARGSTDTSSLSDDLPVDEWNRRRAIQKQNSIGRPWSPRQRA